MDIDAYIEQFPTDVQKQLAEMRSTIHKAAPQATEAIPTFKLYLVHFAAFEKHIGFYPGPSGIKQFAKELEVYETSKGTIRFPLEKKLPVALIRTIVRFRVQEQLYNSKK